MSKAPRLSRAAACAVLFALGACGSEPAAEPAVPTLTLGASDFAFALPDTIAGGLVSFDFINEGAEDHHAQFIRLNDGVSRAQFDSAFAAVMEAAQSEGEAAFMRLFEVASMAGGPSVLAPGRSASVTLDLAAGEYVLLCFVPSPDGIPHLAKGMQAWLTVTAPAETGAEPPVAAGIVDMADFAFAEVPALDSGRVVLEVTNSGQEPHEMVVLRLDAGVTLDQLMAMMAEPPTPDSPPPPFTFMGGMQGIMPGARGWVTLDLERGNYALICFIPSPANGGAPHMALGMVRPFTVGG